MLTSKILILVEDNPDDELLAVRALRRSGIANPIVILRDGAEAVDYLLGGGAWPGAADLPSVILLDLKLPKLSGLEVLERLRGDPRTRLIPVVILTSSAEEHDILSSYRLGASSYVRKPVEFEALVAAARQLSLYWLGLNEPPPTLESRP
jgi:two-component system response regulator